MIKITQYITCSSANIQCAPEQLAKFLAVWATTGDAWFENEFGILDDWEMDYVFVASVREAIKASKCEDVAIEGTPVTFQDISNLLDGWMTISGGGPIFVKVR